MAEHYVVAYNGQLAEGKSLDAVKMGVAQLFKVDESKVEPLFSGQWVSIKKGVDQATAEKYQRALAEVGALSRVVSTSQFSELQSGAVGEITATPLAQPSAAPKKTAASTDTELVRSVIKEAPAGSGALEGVAVDESWSRLEEPDETPPPQVDISGVTMADRGTRLEELQPPPELEVDLGELALDPLGVDMVEHKDVADLVVDTSAMELDAPGVIIVEHKPVAELEIDTSKLSLK